ncbi:unnamed protein product [Leptidea sinapis]|uniref:Major facilitator superfamily (MFS) profile domain-containing protein n=1 Tax=Leptidea sinapis TaxID=189913 RepID=A0A5E4R3C8_9NEOP|nr:unnamed protein product [Leptidea sinapis]
MAQGNELTESNPNINEINDLSKKSYRITMEFPLFFTMLAMSLSGAAISNLLLYRTCVHSLNHTESECQVFLSPVKTNGTHGLEEQVQKYAAFVSMVKTILESLAPAVLSLFLGVWSDSHGRKPLVSDSSDVSFRMTIVEASVSVGSVIGSVASSYLLRAVGNVYLLLITSSLYVIAYVFTNVVLEESLRGAVKGGLKSVLNISLIKEMITECFKERPNHGRAQILLLTVANSLSVFILYGVMSLEYLYTRHKLNWAIKQYTLYSAVHTTVNFVGAFFGVVVVQRLFHVTDLAFSIVAFLSATSEHLIKAFAVMSWHISMLTKILPPQDIAKVFALMCAIEGVSPLVSPALYNSLYAYTISSFPGAIYILSCGITGLCAIFLGYQCMGMLFYIIIIFSLGLNLIQKIFFTNNRQSLAMESCSDTKNIQKRCVRNTIELPLFLNMVATSFTTAAISNILLYRTCVHAIGLPREECSPFLSPVKNNETSHIESEVQRYTTSVTTVKGVLDAVVPACLAMFLGAWSNIYGRKPLLMWSLGGTTLSTLCTVIYSMLDGMGPWWHILSVIPSSFSGSYIVLYTGAYSYCSDISSKKDMTLRMTMIEATVSSGTAVGAMFSSYLILYIGSGNIIVLAASLNILAFLFVTFVLRESLVKVKKGGSTNVFSLSLIKELFEEFLKKRPFNRRAQIILITVANFLLVVVIFGLSMLEYLFTRQKLGWSLQQFTKYSALSTVQSFAGKFIGVLVVQKVLRLGDITFVVFGVSTAIIEYIIKIFAVASWQMYASVLVSMFKGLAGPLTRAFLSKILNPTEVSKIFALMCAAESIAPLIAPILYNAVYAATLHIFPSSLYVLITESSSDINKNRRRSISNFIELPLLLVMVSLSIAGCAVSNIMLYRTCVNALHYSKEECEPYLSPVKNNETIHLEASVQGYYTYVSTVKSILESVIPMVLSLFLGAWSDTYGRKPLIIWPIFGFVATGMLIVIYSLVESLGPWWYILTSVPFAMTGGYVILFTGAYCYMSDISSLETISLRMTMIDATISSGTVIGSILSSYLILSLGNVNTLLICVTLIVTAYVITRLCIEESLTGALQGGASKVLDLLLVKDMFRESFKKRPNYGRTLILLIAMIKMLLIIINFGLGSLEYLFTRQKLNWSLQHYTTYSAVTTTISFFGSFFGVMIVQKLLRIGDIQFTIIAVMSTIGEYIVKTCAVAGWYMYLDIAKIFALLCVFEGSAPVLSPLIYNSLYSATVARMPAAIYLLSIGLAGASVVMLGFVQYYFRKGLRYETLHESL